jgi:hypothetical protein
MAYTEKRIKFLGLPVIYRHRKYKSRGFSLQISLDGTCFNAIHVGKISLYVGRLQPLKKIGRHWYPRWQTNGLNTKSRSTTPKAEYSTSTKLPPTQVMPHGYTTTSNSWEDVRA